MAARKTTTKTAEPTEAVVAEATEAAAPEDAPAPTSDEAEQAAAAAADASPLDAPVDAAPQEAAPAASTAPLEPPPVTVVAQADAPVRAPGELGVVAVGTDTRRTIRIIDEKTGETVTSDEGLFEPVGASGRVVRSTRYLLREVSTGSFGRTTTVLLVTPHTSLGEDAANAIRAAIADSASTES